MDPDPYQNVTNPEHWLIITSTKNLKFCVLFVRCKWNAEKQCREKSVPSGANESDEVSSLILKFRCKTESTGGLEYVMVFVLLTVRSG